MPPRRSQRSKRPSSQALEALVTSPPRRARRQNAVSEGNLTSSEQPASMMPEVLVSAPSTATVSTLADPATAILSSPVLEQLVSWVTEEVTRKFQPLFEHLRSLPQVAQTPDFTPAPPQSLPVSSVPPAPVPSTHAQSSGSTLQHSLGPVSQIQNAVEVPAVHDGVQSVLASLSGEQQVLPGTQRPNDIFMSVNLPLDARVPAKIRSKILQNEFVDFGSLLVNPAFEDKFQITLQPSREGTSPSLALEPVNKAKRITSVDVWLQAFHVFVGIYTAQYPHEAPGLMKYGATIQDLAARGHNWRFYDENFRFLRQSQATTLPWGTIHWELWLRSQGNAKKINSTSSAAKPLDVPRGYCFKYMYHKGGHCSGCSFKHSCSKCDGPHRAVNCNFRAYGKNGASNFPNQRNNKPSSSQTQPQPTPTGASNTRKQ